MNTEKKRILIVDDSADDIHFVMESFSTDYAVLAATSGEKALQIADRDPRPDVILMDVEMPGMNGYETCRRLKEAESTRDIDVIFVSSHDTTEEKLAGCVFWPFRSLILVLSDHLTIPARRTS